MNTPNKLTVFRVILVPVYMLFMLVEQIPYHYSIALVLFAVASITDLIDGKLARKNAQVTNFGKFLDPLADKILTTSALLCLLQMGLCSVWVVMIILAREFLVTSIRLIAASEGTVIAANMWGKVKTTVQMVATIFVLLMLAVMKDFQFLTEFPIAVVSNALMWVTAVFTVVSGGKYLADNLKILNISK